MSYSLVEHRTSPRLEVGEYDKHKLIGKSGIECESALEDFL